MTDINLDGVIFPMAKGPFQNNGAAPWYAELGLGTPAQSIKFALDTGTNTVWTTSSLCAPDKCQHYGNSRFYWEKSTSFKFTDCLDRQFNFGPWGSMNVEVGRDTLHLPNGSGIDLDLALSSYYEGTQFAEIDWDGGLGLPSSSAYTAQGSSFIVQTMMNNGLISPRLPFISFDWPYGTHQGSCQIGGFDQSKIGKGSIFLPWEVYSIYKGAEYIWSSKFQDFYVGNQKVASGGFFALDSGSSQFKGDPTIMNNTLSIIKAQGFPNVRITFPGSLGGMITINKDIYNVLIEEGEGKGTYIPQFAPLDGLSQMILVGSVLMEYCYSVYAYEVVQCGTAGAYSFKPRGVYLFNRPNGPQIITASSDAGLVAPPVADPTLGRCLG
ncbi:hypothetical protein QE363_001992 [Sphingomonas sp. SORGH_AS870]|uniref:pepsin-like aspartic protease n=1 Tax=Sphingomonas sp. SORGH_AS_0870 TaxID=3041801 RepID=UPI002857A274|nr:pepsin-like aspartic protease [Sphingomonas sp. SORGH_AS_0870]MDR6146199.1 hypothetical protein [Sphingomonas sp. SORGH_AS_0870]